MSNHVSRPSPLGGGERKSISTTLLADGQTFQDRGQHNHWHTPTTGSGGPAAPAAPSSHHGPFGPNSKLILYQGTNNFSTQQIYNQGVDVSNPSSFQGLFGYGSQVYVSGGNTTFQQDTHIHYSDAITLLYQRSAPAAAYNSKERFDPPKCHQNTRIGLLNMVHDWANDYDAENDVVLDPDTPQLMWLYGSAGVGKSAIAQTTSEDLSQLSNLAASFFFSRTAPESSYRGEDNRFVTTIAHRLTEVIPGLRSQVENAIRRQPSVFDLTLSEQVMVLIMEPLKEVKRQNGGMNVASRYAKVIVVDGLDECKGKAGQEQVLEAIATLIGHPEIFPFSVFLASRPELDIRTWIASKQSAHPNLIRRVSLLDHCNSDHDIELFVNDEVADIRKEHPLKLKIPADWPSPEPIKELVKRASGQFVYASTVMKYIKDRRNDPRQRLEIILQNTIAESDRPYAELDALYLHILRQTQHPTLVHQILAFRLVTVSFWGELVALNPEDCLRNLLSLPLPVPVLLVDLQSIMKCSSDRMDLIHGPIDDNPKKITSLSIPISPVFHHASFVEFLLDRQRSKEFYVDRDKFDEYLFQMALKSVRDCASYPEETDESESYVIYCFLTILQTQTSHRPFFLDQIIVELSKWDNLNETMLYDILRRLAVKHLAVDNVDLLDIIDLKLWKHFAPAVERRRIRCHQALESAGLPLELFAISERARNFGLLFSRGDCDLSEAHDLLEWHIFSSVHHRTGTDSTNLRSEFLHDFRDTSATPFGAALDGVGFYDFMEALCDGPSKQELADLQLERWGSEWHIRPGLEDVVIFYLKHLISLLDPSEDNHKPKEIITAFDSLKGELGEHWRALTAAYLLIGPSRLVWFHCPISDDIVAALDDISNLFFPPDVISSIEDTALLFDFPYPRSKRDMLNSFTPACGLPRWLKSPWDNFDLATSVGKICHDLCHLHDYKRIYNSRRHCGGGMDDNNPNMTSMKSDSDDDSLLATSMEVDSDDDDALMMSISACELTQGIMPKIDYDKWSLAKRVENFIEDYEKAEVKHGEMTSMKNSNKL